MRTAEAQPTCGNYSCRGAKGNSIIERPTTVCTAEGSSRVEPTGQSTERGPCEPERG